MGARVLLRLIMKDTLEGDFDFKNTKEDMASWNLLLESGWVDVLRIVRLGYRDSLEKGTMEWK